MLHIKNLVAEGKLKDAIRELEKQFSGVDSAWNDIVFIKSEYKELQRELNRGQLSNEQADRKRARIKQAIVSFLDLQEADDASAPLSPIVANQPGIKPNWLWIALFAGIIVILALSISQNSKLKTVAAQEEAPVAKDWDEEVAQFVLGDFSEIYPKYRDIYLSRVDSDKGEIREESKRLISSLQLIEDTQLEVYSIVYKYIGLTLCNKVLALTADEKKDQIKYANKMLVHIEQAEDAIGLINAIDDEAYKQELHQWIQDEKHATRLAVNKFIATAVNYKAGGSASEEEVKVLLAALDEDNVLERENYQIYPIVKWVRKHLK